MLIHELYENLGELFLQLLDTCSQLEIDVAHSAIGEDGENPLTEMELASKYNTTIDNITNIDNVIYRKIQGRLYFRVHDIRDAGNSMAWDMPDSFKQYIRDKLFSLIPQMGEVLLGDCFTTTYMLLNATERHVCEKLYGIMGTEIQEQNVIAKQLDIGDKEVENIAIKILAETANLATKVLEIS